MIHTFMDVYMKFCSDIRLLPGPASTNEYSTVATRVLVLVPCTPVRLYSELGVLVFIHRHHHSIIVPGTNLLKNISDASFVLYYR